ncbi:MAG: hypothetical protein HC876_04605 [Chloroflexaceae bacterium]|nr:hypothetical protein [Chloroflexaceae bacterium]NJO04858.1 hypothetical protein [Chloroflexaceae bacterium]
MTRLAQALGERRLLLVIDDVWDSAHLQPFLEGGPHCTRLVTTRLPHVLPASSKSAGMFCKPVYITSATNEVVSQISGSATEKSTISVLLSHAIPHRHRPHHL